MFRFREFCREVCADPVVQAKIQEAARENPEFALRVAEHGFGRPPQSLAITGSLEVGDGVRHVVVLPGGFALPAAATGVPTADADQHGAN